MNQRYIGRYSVRDFVYTYVHIFVFLHETIDDWYTDGCQVRIDSNILLKQGPCLFIQVCMYIFLFLHETIDHWYRRLPSSDGFYWFWAFWSFALHQSLWSLPEWSNGRQVLATTKLGSIGWKSHLWRNVWSTQ